MNWVPWIPTIIFGAISVLLILGNPIAGCYERNRGRNYSFVPFIGGISGFVACWLSPWTYARYFGWLPLLADVSIPAFLYVLLFTDAFHSRTTPPSRDAASDEH